MTDRKEYMRQYRLANKDRLKKLNSDYYNANREKLLDSFRDYYIRNKEKLRAKGKLHYENNKSLYLCYSRTRKSVIINRTPSWLTDEDYCKIQQVYKDCKYISEQTGVQHHVDHIVPLNGKDVCGMHVPWNLQIITAIDNLRKSNKHESDVSACK